MGSETLFEAVRKGLRLTSRQGYCPYCGNADPDDDGHEPMCGVGDAFAALAAAEAAMEAAYELLDGEGYFADPDYPEAQKIAMALGV